jgi:hypothetical protein
MQPEFLCIQTIRRNGQAHSTVIHTNQIKKHKNRLLPIPQHVLQDKAEMIVTELSNLHQRLRHHPFCGELVRKFRGVEPTKEAIQNLVAASREEANRSVLWPFTDVYFGDLIV